MLKPSPGTWQVGTSSVGTDRQVVYSGIDTCKKNKIRQRKRRQTETGGVGKDTRRMLNQTPKREQREWTAPHNIKIYLIWIDTVPTWCFLLMKQPCLEQAHCNHCPSHWHGEILGERGNLRRLGQTWHWEIAEICRGRGWGKSRPRSIRNKLCLEQTQSKNCRRWVWETRNVKKEK